MAVYYLTLNNKDLEYPSTLHQAKRLGEQVKKGKVKIESYTGNFHGSGGFLQYTLTYDRKLKKWIKK